MLYVTIVGEPYTLDETGFAHATDGKDSSARLYDAIAPTLAPAGYYPTALVQRAAAVVYVFGGEITRNEEPEEPEPEGEIVY